MPAPTKLNEALQDTICALVRAGNAPYIAARTCGIHHSTHYLWMEKGDSGDPTYSSYSEAIKNAEADGEKELLDVIRQAAIGIEGVKTREVIKADGGVETTTETQVRMHWQAAAWLLERRFPERWKNKELSTDDAISVLVKALTSGDEDVARQLRSAVAQAAQAPSA